MDFLLLLLNHWANFNHADMAQIILGGGMVLFKNLNSQELHDRKAQISMNAT
jgi:hypothetical protein